MTGSKKQAADPYKDAAVEWFLRRSVAPLTVEEADAFEAWLDDGAATREAYATVEEFWVGAAQLESLPKFEGKRQTILRTMDRARMTRRAAMVGAFAAVAVGLTGVGVHGLGGPKPLATQSFKTAMGQQATVTLPDGSVVTLNTDTVVRTKADPNRRMVYLDQGQAFFRVAKDRRHPFVVSAGGRTVTALGTAFDVRLDGGALKVVLVEGKVRVEEVAPAPLPIQGTASPAREPHVSPSTRSTEMEAGSQLVAIDNADWRLTRADIQRETSWTSGKIVVDDEALGDVVAELNRYSSRKIVIADAHLSDERISGVYEPGDIEGFARALKHTGLAELKEDAGGAVRIVAAN